MIAVLLIAAGLMGATAAEACRIGSSGLVFPSVPAELYGADFVASGVIINEAAPAGPTVGRVAFRVIASVTHADLEGRTVTGEYEIDGCGPYVAEQQSGFLIGRLLAGDGDDMTVRLFKIYEARDQIITDEGPRPLVFGTRQ